MRVDPDGLPREPPEAEAEAEPTASRARTGPGLTDLRLESVVAVLRSDEDSWHKHIVLTYADGATEYRQGPLFEATEVAFMHGLTLVPTSDDSFRWIRLPQTWDLVEGRCPSGR